MSNGKSRLCAYLQREAGESLRGFGEAELAQRANAPLKATWVDGFGADTIARGHGFMCLAAPS